jgi:uncharacterized zinc-type alcohol dehydrogenase-like protein
MVKAYAALNPGENLKLYEYEPEELKQNEVRIKVHSCGICHSDISAIDNSWGKSKYPMIAGHEIIGEVIETAPNISMHKVGDSVGLRLAFGIL